MKRNKPERVVTI